MSARDRAFLAAVPDLPELPPAPARSSGPELGLYAETRAAARDLDRWRRLHEQSHLAPEISLASQARRLFTMKGGVRRERGGFKFEERL